MSDWRIGHGIDLHRLVEGRPLILGGVEIPYERGLLGHSDADAVVHALMDALLGALALGDIGQHFPDTDPQYAGICSMVLLERVMDRVRESGYTIGNVDITCIAQRPKLSGYSISIREGLAEALNCRLDQVNFKATTMEGLGPIGEGQAIQAEAVVLLRG